MRHCKICVHPKREEIEAVIISGSVLQKDIAARYGLTGVCVSRHKNLHMFKAFQQAPNDTLMKTLIKGMKYISENPAWSYQPLLQKEYPEFAAYLLEQKDDVEILISPKQYRRYKYINKKV